MYLTDIRGFTAEEYFVLSLDECDFSLCLHGVPIAAAKANQLCKFTIHGMGIRGDKGFSLYFARFCRDFEIEPRFISLCDMGLSFFENARHKERILNALCEAFPIWQ